MAVASASITAQNTFTDWIAPSTQNALGITAMGYLNLSIYGTWVGTVTVQRTFDDGTTVLDVVTYTSNAERLVEDHEHGIKYRVGIKTGDFTSGTANVRLSR